MQIRLRLRGFASASVASYVQTQTASVSPEFAGNAVTYRLLCGNPAIDDQTGAGHKAGIVRGEEHNTLGDVGDGADAAERQPHQPLAARFVEIVGGQLARAHRDDLIAHIGVRVPGWIELTNVKSITPMGICAPSRSSDRLG